MQDWQLRGALLHIETACDTEREREGLGRWMRDDTEC